MWLKDDYFKWMCYTCHYGYCSPSYYRQQLLWELGNEQGTGGGGGKGRTMSCPLGDRQKIGIRGISRIECHNDLCALIARCLWDILRPFWSDPQRKQRATLPQVGIFWDELCTGGSSASGRSWLESRKILILNLTPTLP